MSQISLAPMQLRFFGRGLAVPNHESVLGNLVVLPDYFSEDKLRAMFRFLSQKARLYHLRFELGDDVRAQCVAEGEFALTWQTLPHALCEHRQQIEADIQRRIHDLDISSGPIVRFHLIDDPADKQQLLAVTCHHMVQDSIGARYLFRMMSSYLGTGSTTHLRDAQDYLDWLQLGASDQHAAVLRDEVAFWRQRVDSTIAVAIPHHDQPNMRGDERSMSRLAATPAQLAALAAEGFSGATFFGTLVGWWLCQWADTEELRVDWNAPGRNSLVGEPSHERDLGFFITHFPVTVQRQTTISPQSLQQLMTAFAKQLAVPRGGVGYGYHRYGPWQDDEVAGCQQAQVELSYMGRVRAHSGFLEHWSTTCSPRNERLYQFFISGDVTDAGLSVRIFFSPKTVSEDQVALQLDRLAELAQVCLPQLAYTEVP